jgi:hypothetical protein
MSAKATQSTTDAPTIETIADTLFITDTGGTLALDGHRGPESGTAHVFEAADGTALCGHASTAAHDRELVGDASHNYNPVYSTRVCGNCSRAVRSRVAAGDLSTGDDTNDMLLSADAGDEIVIDAGDVTQTVTIDSAGFRHGRIKIKGHTDDYDDSPKYTTDSVTVSKRPADDEGSAVIAGDLTDDRQRDGVTIRRPLVADGGVVADSAPTRNRTADSNYAYVVHLDGEPLVSLRSRHAAVGLIAVFDRHDTEQTATIETQPHLSQDELPGLTDEPARGDTHGTEGQR